MISREKIMNEARKRIIELHEKFGLNPNVLKYFNEGNVYYSYLTGGGFIGSIDDITYDERYEKAVKEFEKEYGGYVVYHAIETKTAFGDMVSLLYVSPCEDEWKYDRVNKDGYLYA